MKAIAWTATVLVILIVLWLVTINAEAQEAVNASLVAENSWLSGTWQIIQPVVTVIVTVVTPVLGTFIAAQVIRLLQVKDANAQAELEKQFRDALHQAALNALKYAVSKRTGPVPDMIAGTVAPDVMRDALEYIASKNPDITKKLSQDSIADIVLTKVPDLMATIAKASPTAPTIVNNH